MWYNAIYMRDGDRYLPRKYYTTLWEQKMDNREVVTRERGISAYPCVVLPLSETDVSDE